MALPKFEKLPLECALDDPPQLRTLTSVFCADVSAQHRYLAALHKLTSRLLTALDDVTQAYQGLAHHMHAYSSKVYAINTDPLGLIDSTLGKCAEVMQEASTWQHILCTQLTDGVLHPLTQQLNAFTQLQQLKEKQVQCSQGLDGALTSFLRVKNKDSEGEKQLAADTLTEARRSFHQCSVLYYNELNLHQAGRQLCFLTPVLAMVAAHQCYHALAHAALSPAHARRTVQLLKEREGTLAAKEESEEAKEQEDGGEKHEEEPMELPPSSKKGPGEEALRIPKRQEEDYFEAMGLVVKRLEGEHERESTASSDLLSALLDYSDQLYAPGTASTVHAHHASSHGLHGYLMVNRKYMGGVMSQWERVYAFVEGGQLMAVWGRGAVAGCPLLPLEPDTLAHAGDTDDRRNVFVVTSAKKSVTLQALTEAERDIWMAGLERAGREGGYVKGTGGSTSPCSSTGSGLASPPSAGILSTSGGFLSSVGQLLSSKLQSVSLSPSPSLSSSPAGVPTYSCPKPTAKLSPLRDRDTRREFGGGGAISSNAPIVFDLGPVQGGGVDEGGGSSPREGEEQSFDAAFLGSMPVNVATSAPTLIPEVLRRVMSARAHHNLFSSAPVVLVVAAPNLIVRARGDGGAQYRQRHRLSALTGWCVHRENPRLFGYVVRGVSSLQCFVYQCDDDASRICRAITIANDPHAIEKEKSLILANIAQLEDDPHEGEVSGRPIVRRNGGRGPMRDAKTASVGGVSSRRSRSGSDGDDGDLLEDAKVLEEFDTLTDEQILEMEAEMEGDRDFEHLMKM